MKKKFLFVVLLLSMLLSCKQSKKDIEYNYLLNHWKFSQKGDSIWKPAILPGTVQNDLISNYILYLFLIVYTIAALIKVKQQIRTFFSYN